MAKQPIRGFSKEVEAFGVSIVFVIVLPLVPVFAEYVIKNDLASATATLAASMYSLTIGTSSRNPLLLALGVVAGLAFAMLFGAVLNAANIPSYTTVAALITIAAFALVHACERWNRHAVEKKSFLG
ncbi:hypothetical protein [Dechloromonas denitrificans]|uniref:hypothetical protein n=1 Tax=Dechloromonas denitrificans TaxID=281362 RepID=UPI001CF8DBFA|nr:hypothetical protein [Dechloromonas denitrificans]UCV04978.1 hypothetical protein KI611_06895 [Dechloromonas denitrificans]